VNDSTSSGNFSTIGTLAQATGIASYDGTTFATVGTGDGFSIFGGFSLFVQSLIAWDDGSGIKLYASGRFDGMDNAQTTNVARFDPVTGVWEAFGQSLNPVSATANFTSWAIFDDGNGEALYLGGQTFRVAGDSQVYVAAKWDGTDWTGVGQTLSGRVTDIAVWDDGNGPALYLCGTAVFEVNYFAKLVGGLWQPAQSGINNPSNTGSFASAFGLYDWNGDLYVGGNFTQIGGFDPVTGAGTGTPIPASGLAALTPCTPCLADVNGDGMLTPTDFTAWINAFNNNLPECDQNGDGACTPTDFTAWIANFNAGCP